MKGVKAIRRAPVIARAVWAKLSKAGTVRKGDNSSELSAWAGNKRAKFSNAACVCLVLRLTLAKRSFAVTLN